MPSLKSLGAAALVATVLFTVPAAAQNPPAEFRIEAGGWSGGAQVKGNQFISCSVRRAFDNGLTLLVAMNPGYDIQIGILNPQWALAEGEDLTARLQVDDSFDRQFPAVAAGPQLMVVPVGPNDQLYERLRQGAALTVSAKGGQHRFPLTGTSVSLAAVRACVDKAREMAGQPTGDRATGITREALAGLLDQAGFEGVQFARDEDLPEGVDQGWVIGQLTGGVVQRPRQGKAVELDQFATAFLDAVETSCPAGAQRELQPTEVIGGQYGIKTGSLTCDDGDQPSFMSVVFALDDFYYSAFFHEANLDQAQAATDATQRLAEVIRQLAQKAGTNQPGGSGTPSEPADGSPAQ